MQRDQRATKPAPRKVRRSGSIHPLAGLRNVGPAARADFDLLGITSLKQLAAGDADQFYRDLQKRTKQRQDPCVWDVFAAAIHQARTGEALPWWHFTRVRKARPAWSQEMLP